MIRTDVDVAAVAMNVMRNRHAMMVMFHNLKPMHLLMHLSPVQFDVLSNNMLGVYNNLFQHCLRHHLLLQRLH